MHHGLVSGKGLRLDWSTRSLSCQHPYFTASEWLLGRGMGTLPFKIFCGDPSCLEQWLSRLALNTQACQAWPQTLCLMFWEVKGSSLRRTHTHIPIEYRATHDKYIKDEIGKQIFSCAIFNDDLYGPDMSWCFRSWSMRFQQISCHQSTHLLAAECPPNPHEQLPHPPKTKASSLGMILSTADRAKCLQVWKALLGLPERHWNGCAFS